MAQKQTKGEKYNNIRTEPHTTMPWNIYWRLTIHRYFRQRQTLTLGSIIENTGMTSCVLDIWIFTQIFNYFLQYNNIPDYLACAQIPPNNYQPLRLPVYVPNIYHLQCNTHLQIKVELSFQLLFLENITYSNLRHIT